MKLRVFHAADGDCLLLASQDEQHHMLIDGGRVGTFEANTRPQLAQFRDDKKKLDVVCVSHIDNDHISGILRLVEDEVAWRKFKFEKASDPDATEPSVPQPPEIGQIWHNALFQLIGDDLAPQVESTLANSAGLLAGSDDEEVLDLASNYDNLATGERTALELSRRISDEQLGIPLNEPAAGGLIKRGGPGEIFQLGSMRLFVLGPSDDDLEALRVRWKKWLANNTKALASLRAELIADEEELGTLSPTLVANPIAAALGEGLSGVSEPNLSSLMFLVEADGESILFTGDGVSSEILQGLAHHGKLDAQGKIHVTVLKVQHHGALANVTQEFVDKVTANHYVFCGNGAHKNPEKKVVQEFARARLDSPDKAFKFWFTSHSTTPGLSDARKEHMEMIEEEVDMLIADSSGLMEAEFIPRGHFDVL